MSKINNTAVKHYVTGALVEYFKQTNQKVDDENFDHYRNSTIEIVIGYLNGRVKLDSRCSDFQCTVAINAKTDLCITLEEVIHGTSIHEKSEPAPVLKEMTQIRVGDFYVYANGSHELFVQPTDYKGNKTTSEAFRCSSSENGIKIACQHIDIVPYGGSNGIHLTK